MERGRLMATVEMITTPRFLFDVLVRDSRELHRIKGDPWDAPETHEINRIHSVAAHEDLDDNHFTWWHDKFLSEPGSENMSTFEIAQAAWNEAIKRIFGRGK